LGDGGVSSQAGAHMFQPIDDPSMKNVKR